MEGFERECGVYRVGDFSGRTRPRLEGIGPLVERLFLYTQNPKPETRNQKPKLYQTELGRTRPRLELFQA